jgi:hypothetical protein
MHKTNRGTVALRKDESTAIKALRLDISKGLTALDDGTLFDRIQGLIGRDPTFGVRLNHVVDVAEAAWSRANGGKPYPGTVAEQVVASQGVYDPETAAAMGTIFGADLDDDDEDL